MLPVLTNRVPEAQRRLLEVFARLDRGGQEMLLAFAEFLATRERADGAAESAILEPVWAERPASETVIAAVQRLSRTYYMLDRSKMLGETSRLVGEHLMQGRSLSAVIDDLEALFAEHFERYQTELAQGPRR